MDDKIMAEAYEAYIKQLKAEKKALAEAFRAITKERDELVSKAEKGCRCD